MNFEIIHKMSMLNGIRFQVKHTDKNAKHKSRSMNF